jgi:hypothetical protein
VPQISTKKLGQDLRMGSCPPQDFGKQLLKSFMIVDGWLLSRGG